MAIDRLQAGNPIEDMTPFNRLIDQSNRSARPSIAGGMAMLASEQGIAGGLPARMRIGVFELTEKLWFPGDDGAPIPPECVAVPDVPYSLNAKRIYYNPDDDEHNDANDAATGHTIYQPTVLRDGSDVPWATPSYGIGSRVAAFWNEQSGHWEICERPVYIARIELSATYEPGDASVAAFLVDDPAESNITLHAPAEEGAAGTRAHQWGIGRAGTAGPPSFGGTLGYAIWQPVRQRWEILDLSGLEAASGVVTQGGGIAEDAVGTVRVYWLDYASSPDLTDSGIDVEATNWCGPNIDNGMRVEVHLDRSTGFWKIVNAKPRIFVEKDDAGGGLVWTIDFHDTGFTTVTVAVAGNEAEVTIDST